ncbi:SnRNP protein [Halorhabdus tiamatea SARL4B]|uniref:SnRNP protein n=1 Tax=Halorhabdus tiamatea SARL4B TaxID=1033806 RepID=U2DN39_9EURY|nr:LSM domain-containing protein [Halorhabdus tiamatea]ERJ07112.1 SnRNP protein [Halorhabdus tiamatea SARL4B]
MSDQPHDVLEDAIGSVVAVDLKDGEVLEGELSGYDQHLNLVLSADEDTTIIRGDNVVSIHL